MNAPNITKLYQQLKEGKTDKNNFVRQARQQFPDWISPVTSFSDAVTILKGKKIISDQVLSESTALTVTQMIDRINPYMFEFGVDLELSKYDQHQFTTDIYEKVRARVARKLFKDPTAYNAARYSNGAEVKKEDEKLKMVPVKKDNLVDKASGMKVVKKDAKSNTKATTKENKKGSPKGVKSLTHKAKTAKGITKTMAMPGKEKTLNEEVKKTLWWIMIEKDGKKFYLKNSPHFSSKEEAEEYAKKHNVKNYSLKSRDEIVDDDGKIISESVSPMSHEKHEYRSGQEVDTPEGKGIITQVLGGTAEIKLHNGQIKDFQLNILNHAKEKAQRDAAFKRLPDLGKYKMKEEEKEVVKQAKNAYGDVFSVGEEVIDDKGKKAKIDGFKYEQGKTKALVNQGMHYIAIDIDGLSKIKQESVNKMSSLMEKLKKFVKKVKKESADVITAQDMSGKDQTMAVVPSGQGQKAMDKLKNQGVSSAAATTLK